MSKKVMFVVSLMLIAVFALSACQPAATQAPAPTQPPAAPAAPAATQPPAAPAATEAPAAPAATQAPAAAAAEITLWHSYHTGGSEEAAITQLVADYQKANPNVKVNVLAIPFDQIFNKWETEVAAGGGPDMFVAPNDSLGKEVRASLVMPLDDLVKGKLDKISPVAVAGETVDGKLYAIPQVFKAVALYYNKSTIPNPPKTTDDLMALVKSGKKLVLNENAYHNFGWFAAFGGKLADDSGKCTLDTTGGVDAFQYMLDLKKAGAIYETDGGKADTEFRQGQADMIVNGPWVLGDYKKDLGDKLGVVSMPAGPKGNAGPLTAPDGFYINPNTKNAQAAADLALFIVGADGQKIYADTAGDVPVRTDVTISDPLVKAFADASATGFPRPQTAWFDNYWGPFGDAVTKVVEGKSAPADAVKQACADMNKANKIQ